MDPPDCPPSSRKGPTSDPRPHSSNDLSGINPYEIQSEGSVLTVFIPVSTARELISFPPCLKPG